MDPWQARPRARSEARKACVARERPTVMLYDRWYEAAAPMPWILCGAGFSSSPASDWVMMGLASGSIAIEVIALPHGQTNSQADYVQYSQRTV